jgi:voltage-gated potassium channel
MARDPQTGHSREEPATPPKPAGLGLAVGWRPVTRAVLRGLLSIVVLTALYFVLPLDASLDGHDVVLLLVCLLIFVGVVIWQVRAILGARYPVLQAIEALALALPLFILIFSTSYYELARNADHAFTQSLSRFDALYFTVTVFSTVGFGDISPVSEFARVMAIFQMLGDLIVLGLLIRTVTSAVKITREHRGEPDLPLASGVGATSD